MPIPVVFAMCALIFMLSWSSEYFYSKADNLETINNELMEYVRQVHPISKDLEDYLTTVMRERCAYDDLSDDAKEIVEELRWVG